jgi:MarR family transcriptional regulator, organic hydroperoxide resistance regulator
MSFFESESLYHIFFQVIRLHYKRTHTLLDKIGIYPGQPPLLFILNAKEGQSQKELADKLKIKPATITVMIKRMEKANLIEKRQDSNDQRISRIFLSEEGKKACDEVKEVMKNIENECFGNFTTEESVLLRRLLMQTRDNLLKVTKDELENNHCIQ